MLGVLLVTPLPPYFEAYLDRGASLAPSFRTHCASYFQDGLRLATGTVSSTEQFNQGHLWFVSLLLLFFLVLAAWHALWGSAAGGRKAPATRQSTVTAVALVGFLSILGTLFAHSIFSTPEDPEPWLVIGNVLQFQPTRLSLYVLFFLLGLRAWSQHWFSGGHGVGTVGLWGGVLAAMLATFLVLFHLVVTNYSVAIGVAYLVSRCLLCLSFLFFLLAAGRRFWNTPTMANVSLAASSYDIYLLHFLVVVGLQALLLVVWPQTSVYLKAMLITVTAITTCYGTSRWLVRPHPLPAVGIFLTCFALALFLVGP